MRDIVKIENTNESRNYSLDLLRIISMLMIISLHFLSYNPALAEIELFSITGILKRILHSFSLISVNCYILISGYYITKFKFSLEKLLKLLLEVFFYSVLLYLLFLQNGLAKFSIKEFLFAFAPTLTRQYWFVTSYVGVFILSPVIRDIINILERRTHALIIFIGFLLFVVYYNLFFFCDNLNFGGGTGIVWFIYLYFCSSYISKYSVGKNKRNFLQYAVCSIAALGSELMFILLYFITKKSIFVEGSTIFNSVYNSIFVFLSSILCFKMFANIHIDIKSNIIKKIINIFAKESFAVYLIHENKYMRDFLWNKIAIDVSHNPLLFLLYWLISIVCIYACCVIIDFIRQIFEKYIFIGLRKVIMTVENKLQRIVNIIVDKVK